jgi:hypothetical protein
MTNYQTWIPTSTSFSICNCNGFPTSFCSLSFSPFLSCSCHAHTSMSHFFECLPNHNVILIVVWHCEGSVLTNYIISTLIDPKSSHSNITSNVLGIACNMLAIPLGPPILIYLFQNCFTHVFAIPQILLPYLLVLCTHLLWGWCTPRPTKCSCSQYGHVCIWTPARWAIVEVFVSDLSPWPTHGTHLCNQYVVDFSSVGSSCYLIHHHLHASMCCSTRYTNCSNSKVCKWSYFLIYKKILSISQNFLHYNMHISFLTAICKRLPICCNHLFSSIPHPPTNPLNDICVPNSTKMISTNQLTCFVVYHLWNIPLPHILCRNIL